MRRIITVLVVEAAALGCVITCVAALIGNNSRLGYLTGVVGCLLIVAAWFLSRPRPGPDDGTRPRPAP
jgi:predicted phage tail protein